MGCACTAPAVVGEGDFLGVDQRLNVTVAPHKFQSFIFGMQGSPHEHGAWLTP